MPEAHRCEEPGCTRPGFECVLPLREESDPKVYFCAEHAIENGFCAGCGHFSAGQQSFDFGHPGLCDNCYSENCEEPDDSDEDYYPWDDLQ